MVERKLAEEPSKGARTAGVAPQQDAWKKTQADQGSQARGSQDRPAQPPQQQRKWEAQQPLRATTGAGASEDDADTLQTEAVRTLARTSIMEVATMRERVAARRSYRDKVGAAAILADTSEEDRRMYVQQWDQSTKEHYRLAQEARSLDIKHQRKETSLRETFESFLGLSAEEADANKAALMQSLQDDETAAKQAKHAWESERALAASAEAEDQEVQANARAARTASLLAKFTEANEAEANLVNLRAEIAAEQEAGRCADTLSQRRTLPEAPAQSAEDQRPAQAQTGAEATQAIPPGAHDNDPSATE